MLGSNQRIWLFLGIAAALILLFVFLHGLPGSGGGGDEQPTPVANPAEDEPTPPRPGEKAGGSPAPTGRYKEIALIAQQPLPEHLPVLRKAAGDKSWKNRHAGVKGIARLKDQGDPALLLKVLANASEREEVRAAAAEGLGEMRHIDAGPALMRAMEGPSRVVRAASGVALWKIMKMHYGFRAGDSLANRQRVMQVIRREWPKFYAIAKNERG